MQNYDTGRDYADMLKDSISWVQSLNRHDIKYFLLLQFFANKLGEGAINAEDASIRLNKNGVAFAQVENGSCSFYEHKTKAQYWIPCYAYFETAFAMISRAKHAVGFWEAGNGL